MRFEVERDALLKPLQAVIGVVERRQTLPILANIHVNVSEDGLTLTATDMEVELRSRGPAMVKETGQVTVPGRKWLDIVKNLPADAMLDVYLEKDKVHVDAARSRFSLVTLPAQDFPMVDQLGDMQPLEVPQRVLKDLIDKTHFSMALQDVRYYLNGLLLELESGALRAVATDGHRLAMAETAADLAMDEKRQVIVPRKGVQELMRLLDDVDEPAKLELGSNHVRITLPDLCFTSKLIDGRFPDYSRVIPAHCDKLLRVEKETLKQALVRAAILSNEKYRGVRFSLKQDGLNIQSNNPEQEQADEELGVEYTGPEFEIGFNASYVLDALNAIETELVDINLIDSNSSALVNGAGVEGCKYVVMPMRL